MHFIFGYQREIPVKIKTGASIMTLVGLAILIILLLIFLSYENLDGEISTSQVIFDGLICFKIPGAVMSVGDSIEPFLDSSSLAY
jgi:hypothetical protein